MNLVHGCVDMKFFLMHDTIQIDSPHINETIEEMKRYKVIDRSYGRQEQSQKEIEKAYIVD